MKKHVIWLTPALLMGIVCIVMAAAPKVAFGYWEVGDGKVFNMNW